MRIVTFLSVIFFMFPIASIAGNVLILDDDYGTEVSDDLISRGHTVTSVPHYDWDGTNPAPTGFDLILHLDGYEYGYDFADAAAAGTALQDFVSLGGVFATTEWLAYDMADGYKLELDPIVPFDYTTYVGYDYSGDYTVTSPSHPLTAGLPATWAAAVDADGGVCNTLKAGATVLVTRTFDYSDPAACPADVPALVSMGVGSGTAIWLNSDLGHYDDEDASPELLQIIANMVAFAEGPVAPPEAVPTISAYGLALTAMGLFIVAGRRLRARKQA
jgi:hypothetical protein